MRVCAFTVAIMIFMLISVVSMCDTYPLVSGRRHDVVGNVSIENGGYALMISVSTLDEYILKEVMVEFGPNLSSIPQAKGNPIPGRFRYKWRGIDSVVTFTIPCSDETICVALHANVGKVAVDMWDLTTKPTGIVTMKPIVSSTSYFDVAITEYDAIYEGYCIDTDYDITIGNTYTASIYSSYSCTGRKYLNYMSGPINYIVNNRDGYTLGEVQKAIWYVLGMDHVVNTQWDPLTVAILVSDALRNRCYIPTYLYAAVLVPCNGAQPTIILLDVPKHVVGCESAWGGLDEFHGKNWATYMVYKMN